MERLRDRRSATDPVLARAAQLLDARPPLADDPLRKQRVRARLRRRRGAPRFLGLARVALLIALTCTVAAASAMIGRVAQSIRVRLAERRAEKSRPAAAHAHHHRGGGTATAAAAPLDDVPTAAAPAIPPAAPQVNLRSPAPPAAPPVTTAAKPARPHLAASTARADAAAEPEAQRLLAGAVIALRHQHDPARATALLSRYLDRYADDAAAEDALALALEATVGRDPTRAARFAHLYLARYPAGRWSSLALRALTP